MPNTLEIITHPALHPLRHGFFTRRGGASSGIFQGLNCGTGSSDQTEAVTVNRARVAEAMAVAPEALVSVHQVHSPDVVTVTGPLPAPVKADALVTSLPGLALTVLTADCQPVLFADIDAQVIGATHAGWRGALCGVLEATVDAMLALGARRDHIRAVIGPSISQLGYEVGPEFVDSYLADDPGNSRYFAQGKADRAMFSLQSYSRDRLRAVGIAEAIWTGHCTYSDPARFYSYRRSQHDHQADYGRLISAIRL
jgi:polyphenol oxidase